MFTKNIILVKKMKKPKINFVIPTYEEVALKIFYIINGGRDYKKVVLANIPQELVDKCIEKRFPEVKEELIKFVKNYHNIEKLNDSKKELEEAWKPLNDLFFNNLKNIMDVNKFEESYDALLTTLIRGSYTTENKVFVNFIPGIERTIFILAEEILHLVYWDLFRELFDGRLSDEKCPWTINKAIWEISETIPDFVLTENSFEKFGWGKNLNRNYQFIKSLKEKLNPFWKNRKNFQEFLIKIHGQIIS